MMNPLFSVSRLCCHTAHLSVLLILTSLTFISVSFAKLPPPCLIEASITKLNSHQYQVSAKCNAQLEGEKLVMSALVLEQSDQHNKSPLLTKSFKEITRGHKYSIDQSLSIKPSAQSIEIKVNVIVEFYLRSGMRIVQTVPVHTSKSIQSKRPTSREDATSSVVVQGGQSLGTEDPKRSKDPFVVVPSKSSRKRSLRLYRAKRKAP